MNNLIKNKDDNFWAQINRLVEENNINTKFI